MNAKKELLGIVKQNNVIIKCARLHFGTSWYSDKESNYIDLKIGYSEDDFNIFLEKINREYDSGYGEQELFGEVWFDDGTWLDRGEYDGSEWWNFQKVPEIPQDLV